MVVPFFFCTFDPWSRYLRSKKLKILLAFCSLIRTFAAVMAKELTPMMKQFFDLKAKHPEALLLFRCGDFYETYCEDAVIASQVLGITLTHRNNGYNKGDEMAGFPHHALDTYLPKLIRAGKRVAICDQLEDPKLTKKLVKRGMYTSARALVV